MIEAPYPPTVRAKGWRFELDYEQIEQSSTWALAPADVKPWLLMMWLSAWRQVPCGSLPADHEVIAGLIGMPEKAWAKAKRVLLRGWEEASDGRLYHPTITARVHEMMAKRRSEADRKALFRSKAPAKGQTPESHGSPEMSRGTDAGLPRDSQGTPPGVRPESDTDHRPPTTEEDYGAKAPPSSARAGPTPAGEVCLAMRQAGMADVNPGHPRLLALLAAGATSAEFVGFVPRAIDGGKGFPWVLAAVEGERTRAAANGGGLRRGPMPNKQQALEARNHAVGEAWEAKMRAKLAQGSAA